MWARAELDWWVTRTRRALELTEEERRRAGPYRSLFEFVQRTGLSREASTKPWSPSAAMAAFCPLTVTLNGPRIRLSASISGAAPVAQPTRSPVMQGKSVSPWPSPGATG